MCPSLIAYCSKLTRVERDNWRLNEGVIENMKEGTPEIIVLNKNQFKLIWIQKGEAVGNKQ